MYKNNSMTRALSEHEIVRRESLQKLRDLGIDPYPAHMFDVDCTSKQIIENYKEGELSILYAFSKV